MGKEKKIIEILTVTSMILSGCKPAVNVPSQEKTVAGMVGTAEPLFTQTPYPENTKTFPVDIPSVTVTPTVTATERPTATATPEKYSVEAISFVPKSVEEIGKSVEVRSPITDPVGYKEDMEAYLVKVHQILENYKGEFLIGAGGMGVGSGKYRLFDQELNPIASVYFKWEGRNVPILTLPAQDKNGKFGLNIMLNPNSNIIVTNNGRTCTVSYDWRTDAMLKSFPSKPISPCSLEVATDNSSRLYKVKEYPFSQSFLKEKSGENAVLSKAMWSWLMDNDFSRVAEVEAGLVIGHQ